MQIPCQSYNLLNFNGSHRLCSRQNASLQNDFLADNTCQEGIESMVKGTIIGSIDSPNSAHQRVVATVDVGLIGLYRLYLVVGTQRHHLDAIGEIDDAYLIFGLQFLIFIRNRFLD